MQALCFSYFGGVSKFPETQRRHQGPFSTPSRRKRQSQLFGALDADSSPGPESPGVAALGISKGSLEPCLISDYTNYIWPYLDSDPFLGVWAMTRFGCGCPTSQPSEYLQLQDSKRMDPCTSEAHRPQAQESKRTFEGFGLNSHVCFLSAPPLVVQNDVFAVVPRFIVLWSATFGCICAMGLYRTMRPAQVFFFCCFQGSGI